MIYTAHMLSLLAQVSPTPLINPTTFPAARFANVGVFLNIFIPLVTMIAALIFGAMLLWGAYTYLTAGDNAENISKAKKILVWSIIGIVFIISAALIVRIAGAVLNVNTVFNL